MKSKLQIKNIDKYIKGDFKYVNIEALELNSKNIP